MCDTIVRSILIVVNGLQGIRLNAIMVDTTIYFFLRCGCAEALEISREIKVDLFLINCQSPAMSGAFLCQQLHALPGLQDVPIIVSKKPIALDGLLQMIDLLAA